MLKLSYADAQEMRKALEKTAAEMNNKIKQAKTLGFNDYNVINGVTTDVYEVNMALIKGASSKIVDLSTLVASINVQEIAKTAAKNAERQRQS
jgi:hypothetical protein